MGFNLKLFFEELEQILRDQHTTDAQKMELFRAAIPNGKRYAGECGLLR